ncbi:MAG: hypothetical protein NNA21_01245 [Nitrospira sp.]|nr:hypothetical protein [Nitrospira sp.]MCP9461961.1 hypothetical protein [Nitrospira sp.]MCP9473637.1 hypothetical protein [Nitrospira sp.]
MTNERYTLRTQSLLLWLVVLCPLLSGGCVHRIHVNPVPTASAAASIQKSLRVTVRSLALEGADHRPGITLLEWSRDDVHRAIVRYAEQRKTFASIVNDRPDLTLQVRTKLTLTSRQGRYHYHVRVQAEMSETSRPIKTYIAEGSAPGSIARWVTASDRDPVESALKLALDDLFSQIEADRSVYTDEGGTSVP